MSRAMKRAAAWTAAWVLATLLSLPALAQPGDRVYTSTREVTALSVAPDGTLWVKTTGGVLRRGPDSAWQKWTRADGFPSTPFGASEPKDAPDVLCQAVWRGTVVTATISGLRIGGKTIPLPAGSSGTHISALLPQGQTLWAALYGDGLWAWDGLTWQTAPLAVPAGAREITALAAGAAGTIWLGTRRAGVWEHGRQGWQQHLWPDEPPGNGAQSLASYGGRLFAGTLEDGLAIKSAQGWQQVSSPTLSSNAPRQMAVFKNALYLRHGGGQVDRLEGTTWTRGVCAGLPRKDVSALAADDGALYAAQWGGWSEWDGARWTHHLRLPELQGIPITALCPDRETLWIGTQGRGILAFDRRTGQISRRDAGLPDDWVTCLTRANGAVYAGTFIGGLARWEGTRWVPVAEMAGDNVTALEPDGASGLFIATRRGVWNRARDGAYVRIDPQHPILDPEAQCLCAAPGGLWVGTRTGLYFLASQTP